MRWVSSCRLLVGKSEGKRLLGEAGCRWEDNSEIEIKEIEWEDVDWIHLAQDTVQWCGLVNVVMNLRVPFNVGGFLLWLRTCELLKKDMVCSLKSVSTNSFVKLVLLMVAVGAFLLADGNFCATKKLCVLSTHNLYY
jgi:hypothetical protein